MVGHLVFVMKKPARRFLCASVIRGIRQDKFRPLYSAVILLRGTYSAGCGGNFAHAAGSDGASAVSLLDWAIGYIRLCNKLHKYFAASDPIGFHV